MSADTDNPIEKALRSYAQRRRQEPGAPGPLHPVNRRLLQAEVTRIYPQPGSNKPQPTNHLAWWFQWQGLASLGMAVLLLCAGVVWWAAQNSPQTTELALAGKSEDASTRQALAPPEPARRGMVAAPPSAQGISPAAPSADRARGLDAPPAGLRDTKDVQIQPLETRALPGVALSVGAPAGSASASRDASRGLAAEPSAPATTPLQTATVLSAPITVLPSPGRSFASAEIAPTPAPVLANPTDTATASAHFIAFQQVTADQVPALASLKRQSEPAKPKAENSLAGKPVLQQFRLERNQDQVTIRDGDGSEYRGYVVESPSPARTAGPRPNPNPQETARRAAKSPPAVSPAPSEASYRFKAQGMNLSLQQPLVLEGQLVPLTPNQAPSASGAAASQIDRPDRLQQAPRTSTNLRDVSGLVGWELQSSVAIGTQRPVAVKAIQVPSFTGSGATSPPSPAATQPAKP